MSKRFTEGICGDAAAILDNGKQTTITEILNNLNKLDELEQLRISDVVKRSTGCCGICKLWTFTHQVSNEISYGYCSYLKRETEEDFGCKKFNEER